MEHVKDIFVTACVTGVVITFLFLAKSCEVDQQKLQQEMKRIEKGCP